MTTHHAYSTFHRGELLVNSFYLRILQSVSVAFVRMPLRFHRGIEILPGKTHVALERLQQRLQVRERDPIVRKTIRRSKRQPGTIHQKGRRESVPDDLDLYDGHLQLDVPAFELSRTTVHARQRHRNLDDRTSLERHVPLESDEVNLLVHNMRLHMRNKAQLVVPQFLNEYLDGREDQHGSISIFTQIFRVKV